MIDEQLQNELSTTLIRICLRGKSNLVALAESHGVTLMQAVTLCLLEPNKPVAMNSLSTFLGCDLSNISNIVDRLVACNFIERKESTEDRRIKEISITPRGVELQQQILLVSTDNRLPNLGTLSIKEVTQLIALLKKAA